MKFSEFLEEMGYKLTEHQKEMQGIPLALADGRNCRVFYKNYCKLIKYVLSWKYRRKEVGI